MPPHEPDLICFAGMDWWYHNRAHSDFQLMTRAAETRKVLLVNSIGMRMPVPGRSTLPFRRIYRKMKSVLRHVRTPVPELPNFTVMTPLIIPLYANERARALNASLVRSQVERVARRRGIERPHIFVTVPTAWDVVTDMDRATLTYNRSDNHSAFEEADGKVIRALERSLLEESDVVLYSSRAFLEAERHIVGDRGRFLDHGVDLAHFEGARGAGQLDAIPRPIIGFFGAFDDYVVDFDLLERVAVDMPDASLVLIGRTTLSMERLEKYPNVHYLGFKPYEEIPSLGAQFDVAIMPWLDNDWIRNCNPIKLKEYLALGLEVVTTWFPEIDHYRDHVHVARSHDAFLSQLRGVLEGMLSTRRAARTELLGSASWSDRASEMLALLDGVGTQVERKEAAPCAG